MTLQHAKCIQQVTLPKEQVGGHTHRCWLVPELAVAGHVRGVLGRVFPAELALDVAQCACVGNEVKTWLTNLPAWACAKRWALDPSDARRH
jgi:hypothetical protein